jgi:hypothetical protein
LSTIYVIHQRDALISLRRKKLTLKSFAQKACQARLFGRLMDVEKLRMKVDKQGSVGEENEARA